MQENRAQSLARDVPLEKGMDAHASILASKTPWTKESGGLQSWGHKEEDATEQLSAHTQRTYIKNTRILFKMQIPRSPLQSTKPEHLE